jgi:hypothetical protein
VPRYQSFGQVVEVAEIVGQTTRQPNPNAKQQAAFRKRVMELAPKFRTELAKELEWRAG